MALDTRHRASIYQKLIPILGEDDANALMTEFPSYEPDELVTKGFLRAEMAELRAYLSGEIGRLEARMLRTIGAAFGVNAMVTIGAVSLLG